MAQLENRNAMAQLPRTPDLGAQREAMKKLDFLVGRWMGEARMSRVGEILELVQTEEAAYKLDGLILVIEGVGRARSTEDLVLQAFRIISYNDETQTYHMRAFNDGRFLETDVKLLEEARGMTWGFVLGEIKTKSVMRIAENGDWTEVHEIVIGADPARKLMEVIVRRPT